MQILLLHIIAASAGFPFVFLLLHLQLICTEVSVILAFFPILPVLTLNK